MANLLQKFGLDTLFDKLTPELAILLAVAILASYLTYHATVYFKSGANGAKQQRKTEQLVAALPCVNKRNATWLQDVTQNGGQPPEIPVCPGSEEETNHGQ